MSSLVALTLTSVLSMSTTDGRVRLNSAGSVIAKRVYDGFRNDILHQFELLRQTGGIIPGIRGNDVTAAVTPYFHAGMSFAEATDKLRDAGFSVEPWPKVDSTHSPNRPKDWYAVLAHVELPLDWFNLVDVYVALLPSSPDD